ncbi:uncharacterized protein METZ01_LOCUS4892, partial [marine metagenome]
VREDNDGYNRKDRQGKQVAEVQGSAQESVQALWPAACVHAQV